MMWGETWAMGIELGHGPAVGIAVGWQWIEPIDGEKCGGEGWQSITGSFGSRTGTQPLTL
jgi:hypothetical protein